MLLKLLMPPYFRVIEGGTIVKWHKGQGDFVEYGDDLFDVRVERVRITNTIKEPTAGEWLQRLSTEIRKRKAGEALGLAPKGEIENGGQAGGELDFKIWDAIVYLRISSSDMGTLRRIHAREDEYRQVGELLAELTTEESEPLEGSSAAGHAATFRIVVNLV
jgi:hypothetical protein